MRLCLTPLLVLMMVGSSVAAEGPATRRATTRPVGEIRRGVVMGEGGGDPAERGRRSMERVVSQIEPSMKGEASKLGVYLNFYEKQFVPDLRTFAFDVAAEMGSDGVVVVSGYGEFREHIEGVGNFLKVLGFEKVDNRMKKLPAEELGDKKFGLVKAVRAGLYDKTSGPREHVSEALLGDPLFLLMEADGHYLCHSAEGYVGYVAVGDVERVDARRFSQSQMLPRVTVVETVTSGAVTVPAGAHLPLASLNSEGVGVRVPGVEGEVRVARDAAKVTDERMAGRRAAGVIAAAKKFLGTKYVWGGKTLEGIDCSGLVQTAYQTQGVRLPRDADQQAYVGQLVATRWHRGDLRAGDTLYFMSSRGGRVSHTGIYVGGGEYIEATGPVTKMTSFDPASPIYDEHRDRGFCFAKRVLD